YSKEINNPGSNRQLAVDVSLFSPTFGRPDASPPLASGYQLLLASGVREHLVVRPERNRRCRRVIRVREAGRTVRADRGPTRHPPQPDAGRVNDRTLGLDHPARRRPFVEGLLNLSLAGKTISSAHAGTGKGTEPSVLPCAASSCCTPRVT